MVESFSPSRACGEGIIAREEVLQSEYYPDEILHRENELREIAEAVKPLLENRQPENLFIYGDSGTGKTACVMHVLKKLERHTSKVKAVYVNCSQHSTRTVIYSLIATALDEMMPRRGLARDEVFDRVIEIMEKDGIRVLLVLDELDGLFHRREEQLLYDLGRAGKGKPFFGIITISNNAYLLANKDMRIKSSLRLAELEFKQYTMPQMADILTERAKAGLVPGSWGKEIIEACAAKAIARNSSARVGLELLWRAAKRADSADRKKIMLEDVEAAGAKSAYGKPGKLEESFDFKGLNLTKEERLILEILSTGEKNSTELYLEFCRKLKRSKRQIRNYLKGLAAKKLVVVELAKGKNPILNTKKIRINLGGANI